MAMQFRVQYKGRAWLAIAKQLLAIQLLFCLKETVVKFYIQARTDL